jgi:hypothetical protein
MLGHLYPASLNPSLTSLFQKAQAGANSFHLRANGDAERIPVLRQLVHGIWSGFNVQTFTLHASELRSTFHQVGARPQITVYFSEYLTPFHSDPINAWWIRISDGYPNFLGAGELLGKYSPIYSRDCLGRLGNEGVNTTAYYPCLSFFTFPSLSSCVRF